MSFRSLYLLVPALLCWGCAQQGSPSGGPRDEDPPVVLESEPANYSVRFDANKIQITFDEYIVLDNVNQELVISPPMDEKPEVKLRKKTLIIQFDEELKENTTYTFNFGSAIKDLHEGNRLLNFEYVFSTGEVLDSLSVKGTLKYAEDLSVPKEPISILLYDDLRDSVPITDIPLFVGRSNDSGVFSVNNLKAGIYKVFALKDGNYNFLFDLPTEEIAFLDSTLILNAEFARRLLEEKGFSEAPVVPDDSLGMPADTAEKEDRSARKPGDLQVMQESTDRQIDDLELGEPDSLPVMKPDFNSIYIDLLLFTEENETQYLKDATRDDPRILRMIFARPLTDTFSYRFLAGEESGSFPVLEVFSAERDSITLWLLDSLHYKKDTLVMEVNFTVRDTLDRDVIQTDTLLYTYREKATRQRKEETRKEEKLSILTVKNRGEQHLNRNLSLDLNQPLRAITDTLISLFRVADSVEVPISFISYPDTLEPTRGWLGVEWESFTNYRLVMLPGAVSSVYGLDNDTLDISFRTRDIEYYGQILLNLENVRDRVIIKLLNKETVIMQRTVEEDGLYTFSYLVPRNYRIQFIHDLNGNGKWDTGKYLEKRQPEPVEFLSKDVTVRSNWDHDVTVSLKK